MSDYAVASQFEKEVSNDPDIMNLVMDETFANNLYASLCNVIWKKNDAEFLVSWRYAAGIVARLRNTKGNLDESYMDYYCSGCEGVLFDDVKDVLSKLGWTPIPV